MLKYISAISIILVLVGCQQDTEMPSKIMMQAESDNWFVTIEYNMEGTEYVERPSITYIGDPDINSAWLDIKYEKGKSVTRNHIQLPKELNSHQEITLVTRSKVKPPVSIKHLVIKWEQNGEELTETIIPTTLEIE
ncbi:hypothetical protein [Marinicrinis sediminis]|uniref:Lipoprotein n=1 Tax=Marinicrinis sediminis TaxID=1652465 RepID=A0ABW5R6I4_9BACL